MNCSHVSPLLLRALDIVEKHLGVEEVARRLGVSPKEIELWRSGRREVPDALFLLLVDLLIDIDPKWLDKDERP